MTTSTLRITWKNLWKISFLMHAYAKYETRIFSNIFDEGINTHSMHLTQIFTISF